MSKGGKILDIDIKLTDTIKNRYLSKVNIKTIEDCWEWKASKDQKGYAQFSINGKLYKATRLSWLIFNNKKFPNDKLACHSCDNPPCVNPNHIWAGTMKENLIDASLKGRAKMNIARMIRNKIQRNLKFCKRGHEFSPENTRITSQGNRSCIKCIKIHREKYKYGGNHVREVLKKLDNHQLKVTKA